MVIKSDFNGASQKATALKSATDTLIQAVSITNDTQTTILGNASAQEVIQSAQNLSQLIAISVLTASKNVRSIAKDFEVLDKQAEITFKQLNRGIK